MPLITSTKDGSPMRTVSRYGIKIDICPTTGGVWLDFGELEKLIDIIWEDAAQETPPRGRSLRENGESDEDGGPHRGSRHRRSRLLDLFDF